MSRAAGWHPSALSLSVLHVLTHLTKEIILLGHWFCTPGNTQTEAGCLGQDSPLFNQCFQKLRSAELRDFPWDQFLCLLLTSKAHLGQSAFSTAEFRAATAMLLVKHHTCGCAGLGEARGHSRGRRKTQKVLLRQGTCLS